ncbi:MAG: nucleoside/nucleotide kinase family protein [Candidatus Nezhaarchaeales archaeon]
MLGDKILFKPEHHKHASDVIDKIDPNDKDSKVILIGGVSGVGKTETAYIVSEQLYKLKMTSLVVSLDDYYDTSWRDRDAIRKLKGIKRVGSKEIQWDYLTNAIEDFRSGSLMELNRVNKYSGQDEEIYTRGSFDFLIIEGLYALKLSQKADIVHHIEGNPETTYAFRKERKKEDPDDDWRKQIINKEYEEVEKLYAEYSRS